MQFLEYSVYQDSYARIYVRSFSNNRFATSWKFSIGFLIDEIKTVFTDKIEHGHKSILVALLEVFRLIDFSCKDQN